MYDVEPVVLRRLSRHANVSIRVRGGHERCKVIHDEDGLQSNRSLFVIGIGPPVARDRRGFRNVIKEENGVGMATSLSRAATDGGATTATRHEKSAQGMNVLRWTKGERERERERERRKNERMKEIMKQKANPRRANKLLNYGRETHRKNQ